MFELRLRFWSTAVVVLLAGCSNGAPTAAVQPESAAAGAAASGGLPAGAAGNAPAAPGTSGVAAAGSGAATRTAGNTATRAGTDGADSTGSDTAGVPAAGSGEPAEAITCDEGTSETTWATGCATSRPACTAGMWSAPGSSTDDPLGYESEHFAFYWPSSNDYRSNAQAAAELLENSIWPSLVGPPVLFPEPYCRALGSRRDGCERDAASLQRAPTR